MATDDRSTHTIWPEFEKSTGRLFVTNGKDRRCICRLGNDGNLYLWWRTRDGKGEERVLLEDIIKAILTAK